MRNEQFNQLKKAGNIIKLEKAKKKLIELFKNIIINIDNQTFFDTFKVIINEN